MKTIGKFNVSFFNLGKTTIKMSKQNSTDAIMTSEHISFVPQFDYLAMKRVMERHHKVASLKISLHWDWHLRC